MKIYASGDEKYAASSRLVMVLMFENAFICKIKFSACTSVRCRHALFRIRHGYAAKNLIQPSFFGVQLLD